MPAELKEQAMEYYRLANEIWPPELLGWVEQHTRATSLPTTATRSSMIDREPQTPAAGAALPARATARRSRVPSAPPPMKTSTCWDSARLQRAGPAGERFRDGEGWTCLRFTGTLIINIGDMLQEASRLAYPPPPTGSSNPRPGAVRQSRISARAFPTPSRMVLGGHHTAHSYLMERLQELVIVIPPDPGR